MDRILIPAKSFCLKKNAAGMFETIPCCPKSFVLSIVLEVVFVPDAQLQWWARKKSLCESIPIFLVVIAMITSFYGCKSFGSTMKLVEKLRLNADLNAAFEGSSESSPHKHAVGLEKKGAF
ncbi:unnamed protein product [Gongylonema pulchrum]|uniref:Transposase n=1 Tax=Gongylonema pulchrum TaxID=637853 RepID=A0A183EN79_9BILA|nr:unnamed protein product [Gongylonema pulchrum]